MSLPGQLARFGCVGASASVVHLAVVSMLVPAGVTPLASNGIGFATAFHVSFFGHRDWTFRRAIEASLRPAGHGYWKMLAVSAGAFLLNQALYAALLAWTPFDYRLLLAAVLLVVAATSFIAVRSWVFIQAR